MIVYQEITKYMLAMEESQLVMPLFLEIQEM